MAKIVGYLNLHQSPELGPLTAKRTIASTSFLGRYAFMDIMLSNFTNSGIDRVGILVNQHPRSISKHLGSRNTWNVNTKIGFEVTAYNENGVKRGSGYNTDIANLITNNWILRQSEAEYVVIAPSHFVCSIDFRPIVDEHIKNKAEITMVYKASTNANSEFIDRDVLTVSPEGRVINVDRNRGAHTEANISMETFVINRAKFESLLIEAGKISPFFQLDDLLAFKIGGGECIHAYQYSGYLRCFDTVRHYFDYSFELLDIKVRRQLFKPDWPIYTVTHDTPPAKYGAGADVKHSFIANGCLIEGAVYSSILSRGVHVQAGASVDNSIIFTDSVIGRNKKVSYTIVDKEAKVTRVSEIIGHETEISYISQGDEV
ncbi:MAG TPA: glucose-1-phosphate adenylyltransferase subunit GlgD [Bacilli bacterium]|nr:glucose-1-phosphate adenylyltransferase subunit GlgD [Bacilli bacterium]